MLKELKNVWILKKFFGVKTEVVLNMVKSLLYLLFKKIKLNIRGFTIIELLAIITILSILAAIVIPSYIVYIEKAEKEVCNSNSIEFEKMYNGYLALEGLDHTDTVFFQYMQLYSEEVCPSYGDMSYTEGKINCSIHPRNNKSKHKDEDSDGGRVPYL
jgi:Tfp pilus assembly protein PilE